MTLEILTSDALAPIRHGFFTRRGGVSSGIFKGLNCGTGSSDLADVVQVNRSYVAQAMNVPNDRLVTVHQIHSRDVVTIDGDNFGSDHGKADGIVTTTPGIAIAVLSADCQPVLFADPKAGVIGAAHAGWRGAKDGILGATVDAMEALGAVRSDICAVIGPCISQPAYEVGPEFVDGFLADDPESGRFFRPGIGDKSQFDLAGYGVHRLTETGIGHAEWSGHCTYTDTDRFYSYRRSCHNDEADYGRLIAAISL